MLWYHLSSNEAEVTEKLILADFVTRDIGPAPGVLYQVLKDRAGPERIETVEGLVRSLKRQSFF
jgi:hypothetical protein